MNKYLPLLLVLFSFLLVQCSKKADVPKPISVQGQWYYTADTIRFYQEGQPVQILSRPFFYTTTLFLNPDGTGSEFQPGFFLYYFTYIVSNKTITFNYPAQSIGNESLPHPVTETGALKTLTDTNMEIVFDVTFDYKGSKVRELENIYFGH